MILDMVSNGMVTCAECKFAVDAKAQWTWCWYDTDVIALPDSAVIAKESVSTHQHRMCPCFSRKEVEVPNV